MSQYQLITPDNTAHLEEIAHARCGFITQITWSSDGRLLAVAHGDGVLLWIDGFSKTPSFKIQHDSPIKSIAFSPDNRVLATAGADTTVRLWSLTRAPNGDPNAKLLTVLRGHTDTVDCVAFSPDGKLLASGSTDKTLRVLDLSESVRRAKIEGHTGEITGVDFGLNGRVMISTSWDATLRLWSVIDWSSRGVLEGHTEWIRDLAVSKAGTLAASASRDHTVRLWDIEAAALRQTLPHEGDSRAVAFSPDGALLASDDLGVVRLWNVETGAPLHHLRAHSKPVLSLAFHPNGKLLISGGGDNMVRMWAVIEKE